MLLDVAAGEIVLGLTGVHEAPTFLDLAFEGFLASANIAAVPRSINQQPRGMDTSLYCTVKDESDTNSQRMPAKSFRVSKSDVNQIR